MLNTSLDYKRAAEEVCDIFQKATTLKLKLIGLTYEEACQIAKKDNIKIRIIRKDGIKKYKRDHIDYSRIDVEIYEGVIVRVI